MVLTNVLSAYIFGVEGGRQSQGKTEPITN